MKLITDPSVYLLSKQSLQQGELDRFLADHGVSWASDSEVAAEVVTETAGRVCYMSYAKPRPGGNAAYLTHIKETGHGSVLEHGVWTLLFAGISRSLSHELVRHRAGWAYSQLSQRYVDESVAEYVEPDVIANDPELHAVWHEAVTHAHAAYVKLAELLNTKVASHESNLGACPKCDKREVYASLEKDGKYVTGVACVDYLGGRCDHTRPLMDATTRRKFARQAARSVLPNATETKLTVTVNARAARHFFEQRASRFADPEIRKLAYAMWLVLVADAPNLFGDYVAEPLADGTFELTTPFRKV